MRLLSLNLTRTNMQIEEYIGAIFWNIPLPRVAYKWFVNIWSRCLA